MVIKNKKTRLFIILAGFFVANAMIAEFIGVKIFSLEKTLGFTPVNWSLFGNSDLSFNLTAGVLLWPVVFIMTDIINEYFGKRCVRFLSFMTVGLILYAFLLFAIGIRLTPADFWPQSHLQGNESNAAVSDLNVAFKLIFGQGLWIIIGSLIAFLIGQFLDVIVFQRIKKWTGEKAIWLRATGSTLVSQFVDSFVVLLVAFYIGADWDLRLVLAIGCVNYVYKFFMAVVLTPLIYLAHAIIDNYLGKEVAEQMKLAAME